MTLPHDIFVAERRSADLRHQGLWNDETILDYFDAAVRQRPEHTAVVDYKSTTGLREALTYEQLAQRVEGIAAAFARRGIKAGDVISIQLPNWWEFTAIHLAAMRLGAVTNPLMPIFRARELSFMLELAESRILVAPRERESSRICLRSDGAPPPDRAGRGPITAIAIETFAPPMGVFKRGRDFAAWLGLAPRQHSTGGNEVLGRISKMGQRDIRQLLIMGAMTIVRWACRKGAREPRSFTCWRASRACWWRSLPVQYGPC